MKRQTFGGAHRGPVAATRQRRTIRLMQAIFMLIALGLAVLAVMTFNEARSFDRVGFDAPSAPGFGEPVALALLAALSVGSALVLRDGDSVRIPTPAKLDELAGRAESTALERARLIAEEQSAERSSAGEAGAEPRQ